MDEVATICDRVLVMQKGNIIADDTPHNLAASVSSARVRLVAQANQEHILAFAQQHGFVGSRDEYFL